MDTAKYPPVVQHALNVSEESCKKEDLLETVLIVEGEKVNVAIVMTPTREDLMQLLLHPDEPMKKLDKLHHLAAEEWITDDMIISAKYAMLRDFLNDVDPEAYVHVVEGWATNFIEAYKNYSRISDMAPEDRFEVAMINYYQRNGKPIHIQSIIDTHSDGTRSIREWRELSEASGRAMVNIYE